MWIHSPMDNFDMEYHLMSSVLLGISNRKKSPHSTLGQRGSCCIESRLLRNIYLQDKLNIR